MKRFLLAGLFAIVASGTMFGQLTQGEPTAKKIRTGNRAEAGDFGLYLGVSSDMFKNIFKDDIEISPLPLVNFKYMMTDQWEARIGVEFSKTKEKIGGDALIGSEETVDYNCKQVVSDNRISPGFAYHFSRHNILDVYAGAELPFGWTRNSVYGEDDESSFSTTKNGFQIGLGAFIGLQAHIADLPLAIGVEYGISTMFDSGLKYKSKYKDGNTEQTSYSPDLDSFSESFKGNIDYNNFDSLKARRGEVGNQFRITLTYYFK